MFCSFKQILKEIQITCRLNIFTTLKMNVTSNSETYCCLQEVYNIFHPSLLCHMLMSSRRHDLLEACTGSPTVPFKRILAGNSRRPLFWLRLSTLFLLGNTCHLFETQVGEKPIQIGGLRLAFGCTIDVVNLEVTNRYTLWLITQTTLGNSKQ